MTNLASIIGNYRDEIYNLYSEAYLKEMVREIQKASDVEQGVAIVKKLQKEKIHYSTSLPFFYDSVVAAKFKVMFDYLDSRGISYPQPPEDIKHIIFAE